MRDATYQISTLVFTGTGATDKAHRWDIGFDLKVNGETAATIALTVTAENAAQADALAERCLVHFGKTGRVPNLPEQLDPLAGRSQFECIRALRQHTGQDLLRCHQAWTRRDEPTFGGDAVLALTAIMAESDPVHTDPDNRMAWARAYAEKLRREEPTLDTVFPLAA